MHPQLDAVVTDLQSAEQRFRALQPTLSRDAWHRRPTMTQWSAAECVAHVTLTSAALLPLLRAGLQEAGDATNRKAPRYRRDLVGWVIWKLLAPAGRLRTRTAPAFEPIATNEPAAVMHDFERLQSEVIACVRTADGLPIDRVKVVSPFDARVRYNLYAALTMVPRHQHRHLLQAERAARTISQRASAFAIQPRTAPP